MSVVCCRDCEQITKQTIRQTKGDLEQALSDIERLNREVADATRDNGLLRNDLKVPIARCVVRCCVSKCLARELQELTNVRDELEETERQLAELRDRNEQTTDELAQVIRRRPIA
jgi:HAMP domain-containing protein